MEPKKIVRIILTAEQYQVIEKAAMIENRSRSSFVKNAAYNAAVAISSKLSISKGDF